MFKTIASVASVSIILTAGAAQADNQTDHIIFSQKVLNQATWKNIYFNVPNAKDCVRQGGFFFDATKGVKRKGVSARPAIEGVKGVKGITAVKGSPAIEGMPAVMGQDAVEPTPEVPWKTPTISRTYLVGVSNQAISEQIFYKSSSSATFYDRLTINTYNNDTSYSSYGVPAGTLSYTENFTIYHPKALESASDVVIGHTGKPMNTKLTTSGTAYAPATDGSPEVLYVPEVKPQAEVKAVVGVKAVAEVLAVPAIEAVKEKDNDKRPARVIVPVPSNAIITEFIKAYWENK